MKVSIAMTTYNGEKFVKEQLESLSAQTHQPDELVVCDDSSSDGTVKVLEEFAKTAPFQVKIFRNELNLGFTRNFEKSLSLCSGDYVFLCDQDDVWYKDKILLVLAEFEHNPWAQLVICDADYCDVDLNLYNITVLEKTSRLKNKSAHINGACTAVKKELLEFILPFPVKNCPFFDVYINRWVYIFENKFILEKPLQVWRMHEKNSSDGIMTSQRVISIYEQHVLTKNADTVSYCKEVSLEWIEMLEILNAKSETYSIEALSRLSVNTIRNNILKIIEAYDRRVTLVESNWFLRKVFAIRMLMSGNYRHFNNYLSFLKDLLR